MAKLFQLTCSSVRSHDNHSVSEVNQPSVSIRQPSFVKHLEQHVEYITVCFLNLIQQNDRVGVATHFFCKLSTLFISYVSGRCPHQSGGVETFGIFAHVYTYQGIIRAKHVFSKLLCQISFAYTGRTEEHENANRVIGIFDANAVALNGLHHFPNRVILRNHLLFQHCSHIAQAHILCFCNALYRHSCHHRYHIGNFYLGYSLAKCIVTSCPLAVELFDFLFQSGLMITVTCSKFKVLISHCLLLLLYGFLQFLLFFSQFFRHLCMLQMHT